MIEITNTDSNCSNNNNNKNSVNSNKKDKKENILFSKLYKYCEKPIVWNSGNHQYEDKNGDDNIKHKGKTEYRGELTELLSSSTTTEFTTANQLLLVNSIADALSDLEFAIKYCKSFQFELVIKEVGKNILHNSGPSNEDDAKK